MKQTFTKFIIPILILLFAFSFLACGHTSEDKDDNDYLDTESTQNIDESEDIEVNKVEQPEENFFGSWTATSGKAEYLYGNIDVTVNKDGTWTANITDEELYGTWTNEGDYLRMHDETEIFDFSLAYSENNNLLFIDDEQEDDINIVLTKK